MPRIPEELRKEAVDTFREYEKVYVERIMKRPDWRLDASPLNEALATGSEETVREFIENMQRERAGILNGSIVA